MPVFTELALFAREIASGASPPPAGDQGSLVHDVNAAFGGTGPALKALIRTPAARLRSNHVARLGQVVLSAEECEAAAAATDALLAALRSPAAVEAAWEDLLCTVMGGGTVEECLFQAAQLKSLLHSRGHDWTWMRSRLRHFFAKGDLNGARAHAASEPPRNVVSVWVGFGNADLDVPCRRVGQIQFFNSRLTLENIRDGCPALDSPDFEPAKELTDEAIHSFFQDIEAAEYVLARVELIGPRARAPATGRSREPIEWARDLASAVVEAATVRRGGSRWILLDGGCYFTAAGESGGSRFGDPVRSEALTKFIPPLNEPTGPSLATLPTEFADATAEEELAAKRTVSRVRWHKATAELKDPAMRIASLTRIFEEQWGAIEGKWKENARSFLRDHWCRDMQDSALFRAGWTIHTWAKYEPTGPLGDANQSIYEGTGGNYFRINLRAVADNAPLVADGFGPGTLQRRQLREIGRAVKTGRSIQEWWARLRCDFDVLLNRSVRERNRIVHGGEVVPEVVASCEPFFRRLAAYLVAEEVRAVARGRPSQEVLEKHRAELERLFEGIGEGSFENLFS